MEKRFLKTSRNSQENTCARVWACKSTKKETLAQVFSCECCEIFNNTFFTEHLWTTASKYASVYKNALRSYADYFSKLPGKRRNIYNLTSKLLTTVKNFRDFRELYLTSKYYGQSCVDVCTQMFNEKGTLDVSQNSQGNVSTL